MRTLCRALLLIALFAHQAAAQDYPSRTIRIVVAYPPGGITDTIARIVGQKISKRVGQPVVVENRPGASGLVGSQAAMSAPPDGYTLLLATPTVEAQPRFDPTRDALPITMVARTSVVLSTRSDGPLNSVAALVAAAKQSPGKITFGTTGAGSINQLAGEWLAADAGLKMLHVPYRGGAPAANALLAGDIAATFLTASSVRALVDAGKLRVLAVASKERMAIAPSWPTFAESGYKIEASIWFGLFAPPKTSADVVNRLDRLVQTIVADQDIQKRFNDLGVDASVLSQEAFANMIRNETQAHLAVIKRAGIEFGN
jgi:tripartite-type tricarboxylate transporter receptor subunit TctC